MLRNTLRISLIALCAIALGADGSVSGFCEGAGLGAPERCAGDDHETAPERSLSIALEYVEQPASSSRRRSRRRRMPAYKTVAVEDGGALAGTVSYKGTSPGARKIAIVKDHEVCGKRETEVPLIRTDERGRVAEAVVYLADIRQGRGFDPRRKPPVINQSSCTFVPHVQAVRVKEDVEILNSDAVAHNINATQRIYTLFNILQPQKEMRATRRFKKTGLISLRCNVHDWMQGWLWVFRHPYYQVTGSDGAFRLEGIPAGKYELAVWQEHLGGQFFPVEVKAGETATVPVELSEKQGEEKRRKEKNSPGARSSK